MSIKQNNLAQGIKWDLSGLYQSINDPQINEDKKKITTRIQRFQSFRTKLTPRATIKTWARAIDRYQAISENLILLFSYASFRHSQNALSPKIGNFFQSIREFTSDNHSKLLWFDLAWQELPEARANELEQAKELASFHHYLKYQRSFSRYKLTEAEEIALAKKDETSSSAFTRLYDTVAAKARYELRIDGRNKELSYNELEAFLNGSNRALRKRAYQSLADGLANNLDLNAYILNTLLLDRANTQKLRGYQFPAQSSLLNYEINAETVEVMVDAVTSSYSICERYYELKRRRLGLKRLHEWDRYSRLSKQKVDPIPWPEAKDLVLTSFAAFDGRFAKTAEKFFAGNWIDAEISPGKIAGAYCSYVTPGHHPYVLLNYGGGEKDILTLAHELGHGVHAVLSKNHPLLEYRPSTAVAEVASIFGEQLVFDKLLSEAAGEEKLDLLGIFLQRTFSSVFRQVAFYQFELDINNHRQTLGELSVSDFNSYYQERLQAMFGRGLTLTQGHGLQWSLVLHFYRYNFYVFTYAFGTLMALSLYNYYLKSGAEMVESYLQALAMGGSASPYEITKKMGVDINDPNFWNEGLSYLENQVEEFSRLA